MPRAYAPRLSTVELVSRARALPGIARVQIIPPQSWNQRRTLVRVTLDGRDGWGEPIYTDFTLPELRAWLAVEEAYYQKEAR